MKLSMVPHMLNLLHIISNKGRELYIGGFIKDTFNIGLHSVDYEQIV